MRLFAQSRVKATEREGNHVETAGVHHAARRDGAIGCIVQENRRGMNSPRPKRVAILIALLSVAAAIIAVPSIRDPILRAAGWALVATEPIMPADIIVISADSGGA